MKGAHLKWHKILYDLICCPGRLWWKKQGAPGQEPQCVALRECHQHSQGRLRYLRCGHRHRVICRNLTCACTVFGRGSSVAHENDRAHESVVHLAARKQRESVQGKSMWSHQRRLPGRLIPDGNEAAYRVHRQLEWSGETKSDGCSRSITS